MPSPAATNGRTFEPGTRPRRQAPSCVAAGATLPTRRWTSGMRKRSHATRMARPNRATHPRAALVGPADRDDGERVAALAGQEDQFDVEHDARDLLAREQVVGDVAPEALEAALRVLDRADDPDRGEEVERLPEQPPVRRLRSRACPSRRAGSASPAPRRASRAPRRAAAADRAGSPCRRPRR